MVGLTAAEVSFAKASELLMVLAGVDVETRQVERTAEALGREVSDDERAVTEQTAPAPAPTVYLGLDGTAAFRCAPPKSKVAAASNPTVRPRPARSSWSPCGRPKGATNRAGPSATPGSVSYNAAVESAASRDTDPQPAAFAQRVHREAQRRGFDTAARRVVVGDGAPWIWNLSAEQFPAPSKSSTSTMPNNICATWPRPSTVPGRTWPSSGPRTGMGSWTPDGSARPVLVLAFRALGRLRPGASPEQAATEVRTNSATHRRRFRARGLRRRPPSGSGCCAAAADGDQPMEVIGGVADIRYSGLAGFESQAEAFPSVYQPGPLGRAVLLRSVHLRPDRRRFVSGRPPPP